MVVILNELSLSGQFDNEAFIQSVVENVKIFRILNDLDFQLSKRSDFYELMATPQASFRDLVLKSRIDELVRLKSTLIRLTDSEPFWDLNKKHSCDDSFVCDYTGQTCCYGLAEACETDKVVFSFNHADFQLNGLLIEKNSQKKELKNIFDIKSLREFLYEDLAIFSFKVVNDKQKQDIYFPLIDLSDKIFDSKNIEAAVANLRVEERIPFFVDFGEKIALTNGWILCGATTRKNDRDVFKKKIKANYSYLTIDLLHGRYELWDQAGCHVGEYYFKGVLVPNSIDVNRSLSV